MDFSDFVIYVDESGDHSLAEIDRYYPIFVLDFCIFSKGALCECNRIDRPPISLLPRADGEKVRPEGRMWVFLGARASRGVIEVGKDAPHPASGHLLPASERGEGKEGYGDLPKRVLALVRGGCKHSSSYISATTSSSCMNTKYGSRSRHSSSCKIDRRMGGA